MLFTQYFPLSTGPVLLSLPCDFCHCTQAQIPFDCILAGGLPVPASNQFLHTALRLHYANHLPEIYTWSYLYLFSTVFAWDRQHFPIISAAWIIHLQLSTPNQCLAPLLPRSCSVSYCPHKKDIHSQFRCVTPAPSRQTLWFSCQQHSLFNPLPKLFRIPRHLRCMMKSSLFQRVLWRLFQSPSKPSTVFFSPYCLSV